MIKTKKSLIIIALTIFLLAAISAVTMIVRAANANDFKLEFELNAKYKYGDTVEIPTATYNGQQMTFTVGMPNGMSTDKSTITLNQTGIYNVTYLLKKPDSNEYYKKVISFSVMGQLFSVKGNGYIDYIHVNDKVEGLYANLQKGDVLVYNDVIDLNEFANHKMLFKMGFIASVPGEADVNQLEVKFTDIYDENRYIVYRFKKFADGGENETMVTYIDCGFGTAFCGMEDSARGSVTYNVEGKDVKLYPHVNSEKYGQASMISMTGGTAAEPFSGKNMFGCTYDLNSGDTYVKLNDYGSSSTYYTKMVSNLYNETFYGERFEGFTDGKVKLTIEPTKFAKNDCGLFISEVGGRGISADNWNQFESTNKPVINVDTAGYSLDEIPNSGKGNTYRVFDAEAYDIIDGKLDYDVKVYYGYSNLNKIRINVTDGRFKTDYLGEYTIEYKAVNASGNETIVAVKVNCVDIEGALSLTLNGEHDYSTAKVGDNIKLFDDFEMVNYFGKPLLNVECINKTYDVVYTLDENNSFTPYYAGDYTIKYNYSDFSQNGSIEKSLKVEKANAVYYEQTASLPEYLIKGGIYELGFVKAYSLSSGKPEEVSVKAFVKNDGSTELTAIDGDYTVSANSKVDLLFKADVNFDAEEYVISRNVVDIGLESTLDKSKLFIPTTSGISFQSSANTVNCLFDGSEQKVGFSFVNILARHTFKLLFAPYIDGGEFNPFERFNLYLTDVENANKKVIISFFMQNESWYVTVNNKKTLKVAEKWGSSIDVFSISFNITTGRLFISGNVFKVYEYADSSEKITFNKGIILSGEFENIGSCKGLALQELNNQVMNEDGDFIAPALDTSRNDCSGEMEMGTIVTIGDFFSADVITPYTECKYSVKGVDGKYLHSEDGVLLCNIDGRTINKFKLKEYGDYRIVVSTVDQNGNKFSYQPQIKVVDYTPPIIKLTDKVTSGQLCKSVNFAKYSVENDKGGHKAFITVLDPTGTMTYYSDETKFTPRTVGKYVVTISVIDVIGNIAEETYTIIVE